MDQVTAPFGPPSLPFTHQEAPQAIQTEQVMTQSNSWKSFGIRAVKTWVQGATAVLLASSAGMFDATVLEAAMVGGFAAVVSLLNNWASAAEAPKATTAN